MKHTLLLLLLCGQLQAQTDTIPVVMMVSDTSDAPPEFKPEPKEITKQNGIFYTIKTTRSPFEQRAVFCTWGYSVRKKQRTQGGTMPTMQIMPDGTMKSNYDEYFVHDHYLTADKQPIPNGWLVWLSTTR